MRAKTKVIIAVAVPVAVAAAAAAAGVAIVRYRQRRKEEGRFIPRDLRMSMEELLALSSADFVPDGLGTSLFERKLQSMTDRQLVGVYALVKLGEVLRRRGVDVHAPSSTELKAARREFKDRMKSSEGRAEMIRELRSVGFDLFVAMASDAMEVLS